MPKENMTSFGEAGYNFTFNDPKTSNSSTHPGFFYICNFTYYNTTTNAAANDLWYALE